MESIESTIDGASSDEALTGKLAELRALLMTECHSEVDRKWAELAPILAKRVNIVRERHRPSFNQSQNEPTSM